MTSIVLYMQAAAQFTKFFCSRALWKGQSIFCKTFTRTSIARGRVLGKMGRAETVFGQMLALVTSVQAKYWRSTL